MHQSCLDGVWTTAERHFEIIKKLQKLNWLIWHPGIGGVLLPVTMGGGYVKGFNESFSGRDTYWIIFKWIQKCGMFRREGTYVYLWIIHVVVWQKPTQHYKAIILQSKIQTFFKKVRQSLSARGLIIWTEQTPSLPSGGWEPDRKGRNETSSSE